jgi:U3 small nucleolar RNA-associated protein 11
MSTYRKAAPRRTHRERAQPLSRSKFGFLEKKKDYVLRAKDYHKKEEALKILKQKAAFRNKDEFYFGMIQSKTTLKGAHVLARRKDDGHDHETQRLMKTQDANYVQMQQSINKKKIGKLADGIHISDQGTTAPNHTIFLEEEKQVKEFDAAKHFDTIPELVERRSNRIRISTLETQELMGLDKADIKVLFLLFFSHTH